MKRLLAFAAVALTSAGLTFAAPQTAKADTPFAFRINTPNFSFGINNGYNVYRPYPVVVDPYFAPYQVAPVGPVIVNRPLVVDPYYGQNFRHNHHRHGHGPAPILVPHRGHYHVIR